MAGNRTRAVNGAGSIFIMKDGTYRGKVQIDNIPKYFRGKSKKEVHDKMQEYQFKARFGMVTPDVVTFDRFFRNWLESVKKYQLKESSFDRLERTYESYIKSEIGSRYISDINAPMLQALINKYTERFSYSTVKKIYEAVKSCLEYAVRIEQLLKNPMNAVVMPRRENCARPTKEIFIPTEEEVTKLFEAGEARCGTGKYIFNQSYVDFLRILSGTGMRVGEGLALKNENIDLEHGYIYIKETVSEVINRDENGNKTKIIYTPPKTKNGIRRIRISEKTKETIIRIQERNKSKGFTCERLICTDADSSPNVHIIERVLSRLCERAGIRKFGLHTLRHYFASRYLEKGGDFVALSKHLGHANVSITLRTYIHTTSTQEQMMLETLNKM